MYLMYTPRYTRYVGDTYRYWMYLMYIFQLLNLSYECS
jgi:hypothetical protein